MFVCSILGSDAAARNIQRLRVRHFYFDFDVTFLQPHCIPCILLSMSKFHKYRKLCVQLRESQTRVGGCLISISVFRLESHLISCVGTIRNSYCDCNNVQFEQTLWTVGREPAN